MNNNFKKQSMKTNKFYLMAVLILLSIGAANAQSSFNLGLKAGVNYATLPTSFKEVKDRKGKAGYNLGVFAKVGNDFYFQPELNYTAFKSEYTYAGNNYKPKFKQANIPLMAGYKLINTEALNFRISAGPDLSYTLNKAEGPLQFDYKKFTAGGVINAGVDIGSLTLDARYSRGFTKINKGLD
ncbi:PorT family protein [Pedobacter frigoris]|uniref:PorT family protein n=2 Tax=Pedobacter frigoris TaxID=2571272 RepID=A0A4U1CQD7_9SPHI|nr:PorT family protein [Pedobacter frigoris]